MRCILPPSYTLNLNEAIQCLDICSSEFATSLCALAVEKKIVLGFIRLPEETEDGEWQWERVKDIYHESRCDAFCFAPSTSLVVMPKTVLFCAAGSDFTLRIFRSDLQSSDSVQSLNGHSSYINDISWNNHTEFLASVSDDQSCRIWSAASNYSTAVKFCLSSAGIAVKWHPEEPSKVLVAEKKGIIRLYNVRSQQSIMSVECPKMPLTSADWSLSNCHVISALAAGEIYTWDLLRRPFSPTDVKQVHEDGGLLLRFSPNSEHVIASVGRPEITLKIHTTNSNVPLIETSLKLFSGMAWHHRLPYVAVASDQYVHFWKIQCK